MTESIKGTDLFAQVMDYANRANSYPLYARLRETPVVRADDGLYIVSTYDEIRSLLFHPKASSNVVSRPKFPRTRDLVTDWIANPIKARILHEYRSLVFRDPPEHEGMRRHIMLQFTPERMQGMKGRVEAIINDLIVGMQGRRQIDLVEAFSYPLPVAVICELLGVPAQEERKFHGWSKSLIAGLDPFNTEWPESFADEGFRAAIERAAVQYCFASFHVSEDCRDDGRHAGREHQSGFGFLVDRKPILDNFEVWVIESGVVNWTPFVGPRVVGFKV